MADQSDLNQLRGEYLHIVNKDHAFTDSEKKRVDVLENILKAEPELQKLLINLEIRQRKEATALADHQRRQPNQIEQITAFQKQHQDLEQRHEQERQRYTREYHTAKALGEELKRQERERTLSPDNAPKKTR
jgi:hypothetical protein